ncbi:HD domain-containing protein [Microbulbifer sp. GL-2]|uniref:HD domain-containing protein n=1 Tax=Microbulbifer sp. GL-2 TaxID=2591606 RepID=UPI0011620FA9|nr:HD domain-containing protein [Microbulbifer sp. GL-2]BBM01145.1 hypothetical protein GL2_12190 [Microbulbifer sp. GL-2]
MRNKARSFSIQAHGDQKYGSFPYSVHLNEVSKIASGYSVEAEVIAFLHGVIEDIDVTAEVIEAFFGEFVSRYVCILSDKPGETRKI